MTTPPPSETLQPSAAFDSLCERGCAEFRQRRYQQAMRLFEEAVTADPANGRARKLLGTACAYAGEFSIAAVHFHRMTQILPRDPSAYLNLGAVLNMSHEYGGAVRVLKRGLYTTSGQPQFLEEFYYNLGIAFRHMNQEYTAIKCYRECLRLKPDLVSACINLANIYCRQQDYEYAEKYYAMVLEMGSPKSPDHGRAMLGLKHVRAVLAGDDAPGMPISSPGLVVDGAVAGDAFPVSATRDDELVRSLARSATLSDDLVTYLKLKILPLLEAIASAPDADSETGTATPKNPSRQFASTVQFLDMMFDQLKSEHSTTRNLSVTLRDSA